MVAMLNERGRIAEIQGEKLNLLMLPGFAENPGVGGSIPPLSILAALVSKGISLCTGLAVGRRHLQRHLKCYEGPLAGISRPHCFF
jgi:hypothetical protein